eukprot:GILK01001823.1.p1 GENE.GILK01001823.1~~GILK01001823.1.p1  ORF type:complete len:509 (-),score=75.27 GILK01001823.1:162-1544(-)
MPTLKSVAGESFFWGHLQTLNTLDPVKLHRFAADASNEAGGMCKMRALNDSYVVVSDPKIATEVLNNDVQRYTHGAVYDYFKPWLGNGMLCSEGDQWRWRRKLLNAAFSMSNLRELFPLFRETINRMLQEWDTRSPDTPFDVMVDFVSFTLDSVGLAAFGFDFDAQHGELCPISQAFKVVMIAQQDRLKVSWMPWWIYKWTPEGRQFIKNCAFLREMTSQVIRRRQSLPAEELATKTDLLARLVAGAGDGSGDQHHTEDQLRDEILTLVFAGHESTSTLMMFTAYQLALNPDIEARVFEEIDAVLGKREPEHQDLSKLNYLGMVMKEVLRMYTPVPGIGKRTKFDEQIGGHTVPAHTDVDLSLMGCHWNTKYWQNPEKFDPERFNSESVKARPAGVYIPFATGPRNCIGQNFAMMEVTLAFAKIFQRFKFRIPPGQKPVELFTMINTKPIDGMWLLIQKR